LKFKFENLENIEKIKEQEIKEPVDFREEFRAIHSENLLTIKRVMSDCYLEVVHPLMVIQEGIERNFKEIPEGTKNMALKLNKIERTLIGESEEQRRKRNTIATLTTLNLIQSNENKKAIVELEKKLETKEEAETRYNDIRLSIKELGLKLTEFGSSQEDPREEIKEMLDINSEVKKEEEKSKRTMKKLKFKSKRPPSDSSSSSSSSDNEDRDQYTEPNKHLKSRKLITPNTTTNDLDIDFIKRALLETENGEEFGMTLEDKNYEFTKLCKMKVSTEDEGIYEILKESECLPVLNGMQCPYCKINYYERDTNRIGRKISAYMERTHLIKNKNQALNILLNIYGKDSWMDFVHKHATIEVNFHQKEIGYCNLASCQTISHKHMKQIGHFTENHGWIMIMKYAPFWNIMKMNLINSQEVNLKKFIIRCKVLRIEGENGKSVSQTIKKK
jgi:hypothetical protein